MISSLMVKLVQSLKLNKMYTREILQNCKLCNLYKSRINPIIGEGNLDANVMFIAQAPGEKEDIGNRMFVGPSGKIFNKLLHRAQIPKDRIYMTNLVKCNLPKNRRPKQHEIKACSIYLEQEIVRVDPELLIPLGYYATKYLFNKYHLTEFSKKEFHNLVGNFYSAEKRKFFPLFHPAALLYKYESIENVYKHYYKIKNEMYKRSNNVYIN